VDHVAFVAYTPDLKPLLGYANLNPLPIPGALIIRPFLEALATVEIHADFICVWNVPIFHRASQSSRPVNLPPAHPARVTLSETIRSKLVAWAHQVETDQRNSNTGSPTADGMLGTSDRCNHTHADNHYIAALLEPKK
jgi:hypothetical protein